LRRRGRLGLHPPPEVQSKSTQGSTKELLSNLAQGFHIDTIQIRYWRPSFWKISVTMSKDDCPPREIVSLNESEFLSHVTHYKNVPIPSSSTARFIYLDNPNEYEEFSAQFWDFISGRTRAIVATRSLGIPSHLTQSVRQQLLDWISKEGSARVPGQRAPRLFVDSCLMHVLNDRVETTTLSREFLDLDDLQWSRRFESRSGLFFFSAFWLSPKYPKPTEEEFFLRVDPIFGFCLVNLRRRDVACFAVRTLRQCLAAYGKPSRNDVSLFIHEMVKESFLDDRATTTLAPPTMNSDYTAIPWITFAVLNDSFQRQLEVLSDYCVTIPEFLAYGYPGFPGQLNSFRFRRETQTATVNMRLKRSNEELWYNLRFDLNPAKPVLHVDFQIFAPGHSLHRKKLLRHASISLEDLWNSNKDLYLGFLAAGSYDSFFDRLIERGLEGFERISSQIAAAGYPLMMRVYLKPREDWLLANRQHLDVLIKIAGDGFRSLTPQDKKLIPDLVSQQIFRDGGLTLQGQMLATRLQTYTVLH